MDAISLQTPNSPDLKHKFRSRLMCERVSERLRGGHFHLSVDQENDDNKKERILAKRSNVHVLFSPMPLNHRSVMSSLERSYLIGRGWSRVKNVGL